MFSLFSVLGVIWLYFVLPETKGLSLEEIERTFTRPGDFYKDKDEVKIIFSSENIHSMISYSAMEEGPISNSLVKT